jgi:hypothetical protein
MMGEIVKVKAVVLCLEQLCNPLPIFVVLSSDQLYVSSGFLNTLRTGSFKLFKRPFPGFLTILTL